MAKRGSDNSTLTRMRDRAKSPMVRIGDRAGPFELRMTRGVENSPIGADATFEDLPWLVDRFDNVVIDAIRLGAVTKSRNTTA